MCVSDNAMGQHAQTMKKIKHTKEMKDKNVFALLLQRQPCYAMKERGLCAVIQKLTKQLCITTD